jgi:hypothetical protein
MPRYFFDPTPEQQNGTLIEAATVREAERSRIVDEILRRRRECDSQAVR